MSPKSEDVQERGRGRQSSARSAGGNRVSGRDNSVPVRALRGNGPLAARAAEKLDSVDRVPSLPLEKQQTTNGSEAEKGKPGACSQLDISPIRSAGSLPPRSTVREVESPGSNDRKTPSASKSSVKPWKNGHSAPSPGQCSAPDTFGAQNPAIFNAH